MSRFPSQNPAKQSSKAGSTAQMLWIVIMLHGKASEKRTGSVILVSCWLRFDAHVNLGHLIPHLAILCRPPGSPELSARVVLYGIRASPLGTRGPPITHCVVQVVVGVLLV